MGLELEEQVFLAFFFGAVFGSLLMLVTLSLILRKRVPFPGIRPLERYSIPSIYKRTVKKTVTRGPIEKTRSSSQ